MRDFGESPHELAVLLPNSSSDGARWTVALLVSIGVNGLAFLIFASVMGLEWTKHASTQPSPAAAPSKVVAVIRSEMIRPKVVMPPEPKPADRSTSVVQPPPPPPPAQGFLRTSPAQEAEAPAQARFIGERNTRATSDAAPVAGGPLIPSQAGREPRHAEEIETTESRYQDGKMVPEPVPQPPPALPEVAAKAAAPAPPPTPEMADPALANRPAPPQPVRNEVTPPPSQEPVLEKRGAEIARATENKRVRESVKKLEPEITKSEALPPVETNPIRQEELPKPLEEKPSDNKNSLPDTPVAESKESASSKTQPRKPVPIKDPAFRGYQQKTKLSGSIARRGTSAMDVADSPLGRYHAQLSRAIEKEWQLNCKRYRDNIVPGSLTVSFLIDSAKGTVKSITFLDVFKGGEIQKGFTIKSIREAELPAIPKNVSEELDGEPLEVTYSFHF